MNKAVSAASKRGKDATMNQNNILFFLTPKAMCSYIHDDYTLRQALEKMETAGYASLPILNKRGSTAVP